MNKRQTIIGAALIAGVLGSTLATGVALGRAAEQSTNPFATVCAEEDSNGCVWDAGVEGNQVGRTYVVTHNGNVFYLDKGMSADPAHPMR